jgi:hypothetical protein
VIDRCVVVQDPRMVRGDIAHTAHVGGQRVQFVDAGSRAPCGRGIAQVEQLKVVGRARRVIRMLHVDSANPRATRFQLRDKVMADESTRAGN